MRPSRHRGLWGGHTEVAVDLGTTTTLVYEPGRGIVLSEPSLVALDSGTGQVRAVGGDAKRMCDRGAASITPVRPLRNGVITEFELAEAMLRQFFRSVFRSRRPRPGAVVLAVPTGATSVEKRAAEQVCMAAGARRAHLIEEPLAAAIGAGLPVEDESASLIVDIGGGTSEVAVISLGEIVASSSIRVGGDELDQAIIKHVRREHNLLIARNTAEETKLQVGSASQADHGGGIEIGGRDTRSGSPATVVLSGEEIRGVLEPALARIIVEVRDTIARTPPGLSSDIINRGIMLAGGGSLLPGLAERLRQETDMPVQLAEFPITCVAIGSGTWLGRSSATNVLE